MANKNEESQNPGKSTQAIGKHNRKLIASVLQYARWIRESELHCFIPECSPWTLSQTARKMAEDGLIRREKLPGGAGIVLSLRPKGAALYQIEYRTAEIPDQQWRHDVLADQAIGWLQNQFSKERPLDAYSERSFKNKKYALVKKMGDKAESKFYDGYIFHGHPGAFDGYAALIETEWSRKSGRWLAEQVLHTVKMAKSGCPVFTVFPYPPLLVGHDHEKAFLNSLFKIKPSIDTLRNIILIRAEFDSELEYERVKPARFNWYKIQLGGNVTCYSTLRGCGTPPFQQPRSVREKLQVVADETRSSAEPTIWKENFPDHKVALRYLSMQITPPSQDNRRLPDEILELHEALRFDFSPAEAIHAAGINGYILRQEESKKWTILK